MAANQRIQATQIWLVLDPQHYKVQNRMDFQANRKLLLEWVKEYHFKYDEGYFERGEGSGYINYSWKPELITPFINGILSSSMVEKGMKVLDFGCAKGFYVKVLHSMGYDAYGIDISHYALMQAPKDVKKRLFLLQKCPLELFGLDHFSLTIAKDVLEHIPEFALPYLIHQLKRISKKLFVMVPICGNDRKFINSGDEIDKTHQIRYTLAEWLKFFPEAVVEHKLCKTIKLDKSKGTLCCIVNCHKTSKS